MIHKFGSYMCKLFSGLILPNGDINWACPCLGGMATGPCGFEFRDAFSCFHYSETDPKGSDCYEQFHTMQTCMSKYPDLYGEDDDASGDAMKEGDIDEVLDIMSPDDDSTEAPSLDESAPSPSSSLKSSSPAADST